VTWYCAATWGTGTKGCVQRVAPHTARRLMRVAVCCCCCVAAGGWVHRCPDQAHRPHLVPRRAAPWPYHGLLRHGRQAQGGGEGTPQQGVRGVTGGNGCHSGVGPCVAGQEQGFATPTDAHGGQWVFVHVVGQHSRGLTVCRSVVAAMIELHSASVLGTCACQTVHNLQPTTPGLGGGLHPC
jgi:hypothetical protein